VPRNFYLDLAASELRMPIGTDLVLHEEIDPEQSRINGMQLGRVIERAAQRSNTPLAMPLMDLRLEKTDLLALAGISASEAETFHFSKPLEDAMLAVLCGEQSGGLCPGSKARDEALDYIGKKPDLVCVGMSIGPFSLATRLLADPIFATAMIGTGSRPEDSPEVKLMWQCLRVSEAAVVRSIRSQIAHGASAVMICEPSACTAFISPRQLRTNTDLFENLVIGPNLRVKAALDECRCDLIFHDCGELIDQMVEVFAHRLHPAILSLGSSRKLWEDARLVPKDVVLYGNLPSKSFYSDGAMPLEEVVRRTEELVELMKRCGHPHIVGSECDVLFVPESQATIRKKVDAMMAKTKIG